MGIFICAESTLNSAALTPSLTPNLSPSSLIDKTLPSSSAPMSSILPLVSRTSPPSLLWSPTLTPPSLATSLSPKSRSLDKKSLMIPKKWSRYVRLFPHSNNHFNSLWQHCIRMHINYKMETGIEQKAAFPKRVIVFRDGVSEGQFKQVIEGGQCFSRFSGND